MCTTGGTDLLLVATELGSLYLYDIKNAPLHQAQTDKLNYSGFLHTQVKDFTTFDEQKQNRYFSQVRMRYKIQTHSYMTDGLKGSPHYSRIIKLAFISKSSSGIA